MYGAEGLPITSPYSSFSITITMTWEARADGSSEMAPIGSGLPGWAAPQPATATAATSSSARVALGKGMRPPAAVDELRGRRRSTRP